MNLVNAGRIVSQNWPKALTWAKEAPFYQAGLCGYSDQAMRLIARRHGCPYCVTEAMLDHFLINGGKGLQAATLCDEDHPIAGQLMGSHPKEIAQGAKILVELGYDVIDINLACPVRKIKRKCRGGHLMGASGEAIDVLEAVADAVGKDVPVSVKLRRGYNDTDEATEAFDAIFQAVIDLGYAMATVHGRTVKQKYVGPSDWSFLAKLTKRYRSAMESGFMIFGSGDIFSPQAIFDMIEQTNVTGVSVARGCIGDPWVFHQAGQLMRGEPLMTPTLKQQRDVLAEHFKLAMNLQDENKTGRMMRKFGIKFSQHHPQAKTVATAFIAVTNLEQWHQVLDEYYPK